MRELLRCFGLSQLEITAYAALARLGGAKVSALAAVTGCTRSACQEYIRSLEEKGLINSTKIGNKFLYQAEDPDLLRQIITERMFVVDRLLPELRERQERGQWQVRVVSRSESEQVLKRARKKGSELCVAGDSNMGGAVIDKKKVIVWSGDSEMPAVEIRSRVLARLHLDLFFSNKKSPV